MSSYPSTKERTNYAKLCRAVVDLCTQVLRDILIAIVLPTELFINFQNCQEKDSKHFEKDKALIRNSSANGNYKEFDITLLYKLIRALSTQCLLDEVKQHISSDPSGILSRTQECPTLQLTAKETQLLGRLSSTHCLSYSNSRLLEKLLRAFSPGFSPVIPAPCKGWSSPIEPSPSETNLGDDIERIRAIRNTVYGHIPNTDMDDNIFNQHWQVLEEVMYRMDKREKLQNRYRLELEYIRSMGMDYRTERKYTEAVTAKIEQDQELRSELEHLKHRVSELEERTLVQVESTEIQAQQEENRNEEVEILENVKLRKQQETTLSKIQYHSLNRTFICTAAVKKGIKHLMKNGIVVIIGNIGDGKTTVSIEIVSQIAQRENTRKLVILSDIGNWDDVIFEDEKYIVLLDDALGKSVLDKECITVCENKWSRLSSTVTSGRVKLLITIQCTIYESCMERLQKCAIFHDENILDLSKEILLEEKLRIFERYSAETLQICENKWEENLSDEPFNIYRGTVNEILNAPCAIGFPLACSHFSRHRNFVRHGVNFFQDVRNCLAIEINNLRTSNKPNDILKYSLLVSVLLSDFIDPTDISIIKALGRILDELQYEPDLIHTALAEDIAPCLRELEVIFFREQKQKYIFQHEIIQESVLMSLVIYCPEVLLKNCNTNLINTSIRTQISQNEENASLKCLHPRDYSILMKRFLNDLERGQYWWLDHQSIDDSNFVSCLCELIQEDTYLRVLTKKCEETTGLFYQTYVQNKLPLFTFLCENVMKASGLRDSSSANHCFYLASMDGNIRVLNCLLENKIGMDEVKHALRMSNLDVLIFLINHHRVQLQDLHRAWTSICGNCTDEIIKNIFRRWNNLDTYYLVQLLNCKHDNTKIVKTILKQRKDRELENCFKDIFSLECSKDNIMHVRFLITITARYTPEWTIYQSREGELANIHLAAFFGRDEIVKELLQLGTSIEESTEEALSVLQFTLLGCVHSDMDILDVSEFVHHRSPKIYQFCNHLLAYNFGNMSKYVSIIHHLINLERCSEDELDMKVDSHDNTLAHYSVLHNSVSIIELLKNRRQTSLSVPNDKGITPIHMAIYLHRKRIFRIIWAIHGNRRDEKLEEFLKMAKSRIESIPQCKEDLHIEIGENNLVFRSEENYDSIVRLIKQTTT